MFNFKRLLSTVLLLFTCAAGASVSTVSAAPPWLRLQSRSLRRVLVAGACVANFADALSTSRAIQAGGYERNPVVRSPARMIGFKVGVCGATVLLGERVSPGQAAAVSGMAGAQIGMFSWATVHNVQVARRLRLN